MMKRIRIVLSKEKKVLLITLAISFFLIIFGILSRDIGVLANIIFLSIFLTTIPQLIFSYINYREMKEMELRFPHFLRDLVESTRAGLPLHKAIISASGADYGPLNKEIKKMADQLSWNVNIIEVLDQLKKRLRASQTLTRVIRILMETYKSGGSVDDTLNSLSETLLTIQETEKERKSMLNQYVVATYAISFVFIGIVVGINRLMVPIFESMSMSPTPIAGVVPNPCDICVHGGGVQCTPCKVYFRVCSLFRIETGSISCYYFALFFSMSIIQAATGGLVAGQIGEGSVKAGVKHSLILLAITIGAFLLLVRLRLLGV